MYDFFDEEPPVREIKEEPRQEKSEAVLPTSIELEDAINLLKLLRKVDIKGI